MRVRIGLVLLAAALVAASAGAQTTTATVLGTVTDQQKARLPGATVTATDVNTGAQSTQESDANGRFRIAALRPGVYELKVELAGFGVQVRKDIQLFVSQEATIDFELLVAGVTETVAVTASAPLVETTKSEVSTVVDRRQLDALPLVGRNFADLTRLTPDVQSSDRIGGGQSSIGNTYLIDGVSNDRAWTGGNRTGYSAETIREFRVITEQYAAEFGQASGGVINVVTRSGTNRFEQRLFLFDRAARLDARNAFATTKAPFDRQQAGGFAGGPIMQNRLFYFASYEGIRQNQTATVTTPVERGDYPVPLRQHQAFGRVDYQLSPSQNWTTRYTEERYDQSNAGVGGASTVQYGDTSFYRDHDFYSSLTSVFGSTKLNELRIQYGRRPGGSVPNTPSGPELVFASSNQGKAYSDPQQTTEQRVQFVDNFSWHVTGRGGEHDVKSGIDLNRSRLAGFFCNFCDGQFIFPKDAYNAADPSTFPTTYTQRIGSSDFGFNSTNLGLFVQDNWRPLTNLTLNVGVRYDRNWYAGVLTNSNFSPRLGLSFDPTNKGTTVIRGGGGLFRDKISMNQWLIIVLNVINAQDFVVLTSPGYPDPFSGKPKAPTPANTERFDPNMQTPYAQQVTGGVKHEIARGFSVSADYVYVHGLDQLRRRDLNAPVNGSKVRPDPTMGRELIHESTGERVHHALILAAERRVTTRARFTAAYTLSNTKSDSEARNSTALPTDQYNLKADWGPADVDARHNFVATGQITLPAGVNVAAILQLRSAFPFNVVSGRDTNNDSRSGDRPDPDSNGVYPTYGNTTYGRFSIPVNRPGTLGRNAFRGPDWRRLDLRVSRAFQFGPRRIEVLAEAFNATNRVNYNGYQSSIQSRFFGLAQSADDPRQVQLGIRFDF